MMGTAVRVSPWELQKTPVQAWCIWETRCAMGTSSIDVPCAARLHLGSFLNLIPGMAFVACTGNSKKPPNPLGKEIFSAELRRQKSKSQLSCRLRWMSLTVGKGRRTIILKPLFGWWLIRAVHHRETNPGVNRCLLWILQPVMKKIRESTTGYSNLTCSAWERQPTSPNLCPAAQKLPPSLVLSFCPQGTCLVKRVIDGWSQHSSGLCSWWSICPRFWFQSKWSPGHK